MATTLNLKGFPEDLYESLVGLAKEEHRSLTQGVIYLLRKAMEERLKKKPSIMDLQGLGKELWSDIKAEDHISMERDSWD
jgi:hypothetical protein